MAEFCDACDLHELITDDNKQCIDGRFLPEEPIWVVGEAPGEREGLAGKPFVGDAGKLLMRCLKDIRRHSDVTYYRPFLTNAVNCRPPNNRNPYVKEVNACIPHLYSKLVEYKPEVLVAVGNVPMKALIGKQGIKRLRGSMSRLKPEIKEALVTLDKGCRKYDPIVLSTFHPAGVLRNPSWVYYLRQDLEKAMGLVGTEIELETPCDYRILDNFDDVDTFIKKAEGRLCSFDLETTGLAPLKHHILCLSLSIKKGGAYLLPLKRREAFKTRKQYDTYQTKLTASLKKLFHNSKIKYAGQNAKFDLGFLRHHYGIGKINLVIDTMLAHHLLEETAPTHALDALSVQYTNMGVYSDEIKQYTSGKRKDADGKKTDVDKNMEDVPEEILWEYACKDADCTYRVAEILATKLKNKKALNRLNERMSLPMSDVLVDMELEGIHINMDKANTLLASTQSKKQLTEKKLLSIQSFYMKDSEGFNLNSDIQVGNLFYKVWKVPVFRKTDGGRPSVNEDTITDIIAWTGKTQSRMHTKRLKAIRLFCELLLKYRKVYKLLSTYLITEDGKRGMLSKVINGKLHTSLHLSITSSGRLSSSDPNLQNVPPVMREIFIPGKGYVFVEADFDRVEMWVAAYITQDKTLLQAYESNEDLHMLSATKIYKKKPSEVTKEERRTAKSANFGVLYGMAAKGLSETANMEIGEAEVFMDEYFKAFPGVKRWREEVEREILKHEYLTQPFGRERHFPGIGLLDKYAQGEMIRSGTNFMIQSTASDILSLATVRIRERFRETTMGAKLVLSVHDQLISRCRKSVCFDVKDIMRKELELPVPELDNMIFPVEIKVGYWWDDKDRSMSIARRGKK